MSLQTPDGIADDRRAVPAFTVIAAVLLILLGDSHGLGTRLHAEGPGIPDFKLVAMPVAGGGVSAGGGYALTGALVGIGAASSSAVTVVPGPVFVATSGILGGAVVRAPGIHLSVQRTPNGSFEITWLESAEGFLLESSPAVWPKTDWSPVVPQPTDHRLIIDPSDTVRYYRLHKR